VIVFVILHVINTPIIITASTIPIKNPGLPTHGSLYILILQKYWILKNSQFYEGRSPLRVWEISNKDSENVVSWYKNHFSLQKLRTSSETNTIRLLGIFGNKWCSICLLSHPNTWWINQPQEILREVIVWSSNQEYSWIVFPSKTGIPIWFTINANARCIQTRI
jgi:hypothetical protein